MAVIRPFRCIHPAKGLEPDIAALPYDVYHREDAWEAVQGKPLSFLNIDRPETMFPPEQVPSYGKRCLCTICMN